LVVLYLEIHLLRSPGVMPESSFASANYPPPIYSYFPFPYWV
jgi:hypothetical protein